MKNVLYRALGQSEDVDVDMYYKRLHIGDRLVLCSDGLTRTLTETQIEGWMEQGTIAAAVEGLIGATLAAGAPDNVTVLIAEAYPDTV